MSFEKGHFVVKAAQPRYVFLSALKEANPDDQMSLSARSMRKHDWSVVSVLEDLGQK